MATATEAALKVIASLTRSLADMVLPTTRDVNLTGEMYTWHEPLFAQMASRYQIPTRRNLQTGNAAKTADYIRGRWALSGSAAPSTTASWTWMSSSCRPTWPTANGGARRWKKAPETDVQRHSRLENAGQINAYEGVPAISVPCGFTSAGLPVGLMIAGPRFAEGRVLALARAFEQATEWHTKRPPIAPDTAVPALARTTPVGTRDQGTGDRGPGTRDQGAGTGDREEPPTELTLAPATSGGTPHDGALPGTWSPVPVRP